MVANQYFTIDAHCHIYPEKIAAKAVAGTDAFYGTVARGRGVAEDLLCHVGRAGVDRFLVQSVATTPHQVASINRFVAQEVAAHPDRLIGLGTLHPDSTDIRGDIDELVSLGLHGVKLHPDIQDFPLDDERCADIYSYCEQIGLPLLVHAGDVRYDRSNPNRLCPVLQSYPKLTVVAAHLGGYTVWDSACELLHGYDNLYVDCSSCFWKLSRERAREIILSYGTDRVLFGSDYPMWLPDHEIDYLLSMNLTEQDYANIFAKNAIRAFGLPLEV